MRIYLCDDEKQILQDMATKIQVMQPDSLVKCYEKSLDLWESLRTERCDVLCLDIDMPQISGLELAALMDKLEAKPLLVFVTSHDELVYDSLKFHPFGFVRKAYFAEEMEKLLTDCAEELESRERYFSFQSGAERIKLPLSEILFFESEGNYVKLAVKSGEIYRFRDTLYSLEAALSGNGFVRIHKGFLVNQRTIRTIRGNEITLEEGTCLPIGKSYASSARRRLIRYMTAAEGDI
ncbi:MAG: LytTR family DNA-binding domain-containing protein [Candidatus Gastranaerophilales bacterium]|nr:LytTR family DNA-binding domain-containing protein [Candidatus Gastranaerophilales bacterium]